MIFSPLHLKNKCSFQSSLKGKLKGKASRCIAMLLKEFGIIKILDISPYWIIYIAKKTEISFIIGAFYFSSAKPTEIIRESLNDLLQLVNDLIEDRFKVRGVYTHRE